MEGLKLIKKIKKTPVGAFFNESRIREDIDELILDHKEGIKINSVSISLEYYEEAEIYQYNNIKIVKIEKVIPGSIRIVSEGEYRVYDVIVDVRGVEKIAVFIRNKELVVIARLASDRPVVKVNASIFGHGWDFLSKVLVSPWKLVVPLTADGKFILESLKIAEELKVVEI